MSKVMKRIKNIKRKIHCKMNPVSYAKSLGVKVGDNVRFYGAKDNTFSTEPWLITIGNNVHIAGETRFITHDGGNLILKKEFPDFVITGNITIGDNTYIGIRCIVLPGVTIGKNCIIGAGAIVTKDIPDNSVAVGVPARVVSTIEKYAQKMQGVVDGEYPQYYADLSYMHSLNPNNK